MSSNNEDGVERDDDGEKKTVLRVLFEESMKKPVKFAFSLGQAADAEATEPEQEYVAIKDPSSEVRLRPLSQVFIQAQEEIRKRWPEHVGIKFVRSDESKEKWIEARARLKTQSKKRIREAAKKGITSGPKTGTKKLQQ